MFIKRITILKNKGSIAIYRKKGWIKIYSQFVGRVVYFVKNIETITKLPDSSFPVFTESDIEAFIGLDLTEAKLLIETKILFGGRITAHQEFPPLKGQKQREANLNAIEYWNERTENFRNRGANGQKSNLKGKPNE